MQVETKRLVRHHKLTRREDESGFRFPLAGVICPELVVEDSVLLLCVLSEHGVGGAAEIISGVSIRHVAT